jgi:dsDNA-specific endonuclease/ATPase MutS2
LTDYIRAAQEKKITSIKIIHGKGQGILKRKVHSQLSKMPQVADFYDGGYGQGGWGVTIAILKI